MDIETRILNDTSKISGRRTMTFRDIAASYKKEISKLDINSIYSICESLLETCKRGETIIAYQIIYDVKDIIKDYQGTSDITIEECQSLKKSIVC